MNRPFLNCAQSIEPDIRMADIHRPDIGVSTQRLKQGTDGRGEQVAIEIRWKELTNRRYKELTKEGTDEKREQANKRKNR